VQNFNLIALKDSQAVEKLTRITILLAKITILFLPVSLMTAYFSTELRGVKGAYTQTEYWISFAVTMVLSLLVLVLFGYASGTIEGRPIYQSLSRTYLLIQGQTRASAKTRRVDLMHKACTVNLGRKK
jgi:heme/copper-type cytochrome/quinol oxidase subunit 2